MIWLAIWEAALGLSQVFMVIFLFRTGRRLLRSGVPEPADGRGRMNHRFLVACGRKPELVGGVVAFYVLFFGALAAYAVTR